MPLAHRAQRHREGSKQLVPRSVQLVAYLLVQLDVQHGVRVPVATPQLAREVPRAARRLTRAQLEDGL